MDYSEDFINDTAEKYRIYFKDIDEMSEQPNNTSFHVGLDIGTMNIVCAKSENDSIQTSSLRNVFLELDKDAVINTDLSLISHVKIDNSIYILSEDAYSFGNIFGKQVSRPMSKGMISSNEIDAIDILGVIIKSLIGKAPNNDSICCYSIPANPIDSDMNVLFHDNVFKRLIGSLGWKSISLYEAVALIYSECSSTEFTGIGISFGAGMTNIAVVFKGIPALTFSLARGGDWIDENASMHMMGAVSNRITAIKEKPDFDLVNFNIGDKKERRIREALSYYYQDLINYTANNITKELSKITTQFPSRVPVIISGGTSKPSGFLDMMKQELNNYEFPFDISEVKYATNPLTAVAEGCLVKSFK